MSHPMSEPARERRVSRASVSRVGLFSHMPEATRCSSSAALWPATASTGDPPRSQASSAATSRWAKETDPRATGDKPLAAPV